MQQLMLIQKMEEKPDWISPVIFQQNKGDELLSTFIILNNFAMKDTAFTDLCTDAEKQIWVKIETVILLVLRSDSTFLKAYITLQEQFAAITTEELG
jgi:hypothetical protein